MKILYLFDTFKEINKFSPKDRARLERTSQFFEEKGFQIGSKYIKKIFNNIWELRAGKIRLFLFIKQYKAFGIHVIYKKSQKLSRKDLKLVVKRSKLV